MWLDSTFRALGSLKSPHGSLKACMELLAIHTSSSPTQIWFQRTIPLPSFSKKTRRPGEGVLREAGKMIKQEFQNQKTEGNRSERNPRDPQPHHPSIIEGEQKAWEQPTPIHRTQLPWILGQTSCSTLKFQETWPVSQPLAEASGLLPRKKGLGRIYWTDFPSISMLQEPHGPQKGPPSTRLWEQTVRKHLKTKLTQRTL